MGDTPKNGKVSAVLRALFEERSVRP